MKLLRLLPRASAPALLGSLVSLAAQALFAAFLLKLFEPAAVGLFSVINQVAFSWAALALAQSTVTLLADPAHPAQGALRAWRASLARMMWLAPVAFLAWWWTISASMDAVPVLWIIGIAATQLSWSIAQSLFLRTGPGLAIFLVRCIPPSLAAGLAWLCASLLPRNEPTALLIGAFAGYLVGAFWLLPAVTGARAFAETAAAGTTPSAGRDDRSARLKMIHTFMDLASSTLIAVQWTRTWGPAEAGYLLVLLRVFGFVPALVNTAWAQVLLSRGETRVRSSLVIGILACLGILTLAALVHAAVAFGWLAASWSGLHAYLWPVAVWQMAASLFGCLSHLPFMAGRARAYSMQCMVIDALLIAALLLGAWIRLPPGTWVLTVAIVMTIALLAQAWYFRLRSQESVVVAHA